MSLSLVAFVSLFACTSEGTPCYPGDYLSCDCPGEGAPRGLSQCSSDGSSYGACDCSGRVPGLVLPPQDANASDASTADASALLAFMAPCEKDAECDTGLCFVFNAKGPRCSHPCNTAGDCAPPSPGCNNEGVCKAP